MRKCRRAGFALHRSSLGVFLVSGGVLGLAAAARANLTWDDASNDSQWDVGSSANWNNGSSNTTFNNGANVIFNDNNGINPLRYIVILDTAVSPASILVSNNISGNNYIIEGSGTITGTGSLTKTGSSALILDTANSYTGGTSISAGAIVIGVNGALGKGSVSISGSGVLALAASTGLATITSLSLSGSGFFDVDNNHLIINYGSAPDPTASIAALLKTGYNGGAWDGAGGIVSSAAESTPGYGLGYADSADPGNPAGLSAGTIEIKYTLLGDANLSGVVDGTDFAILAANFNKGVSRWDQGDFNYDNVVDGTDFGDLAANFNKGASGASVGGSALTDPALVAFAQANGLMADVPEPASAVILGAAALLRRRRRRG